MKNNNHPWRENTVNNSIHNGNIYNFRLQALISDVARRGIRFDRAAVAAARAALLEKIQHQDESATYTLAQAKDVMSAQKQAKSALSRLDALVAAQQYRNEARLHPEVKISSGGRLVAPALLTGSDDVRKLLLPEVGHQVLYVYVPHIELWAIAKLCVDSGLKRDLARPDFSGWLAETLSLSRRKANTVCYYAVGYYQRVRSIADEIEAVPEMRAAADEIRRRYPTAQQVMTWTSVSSIQQDATRSAYEDILFPVVSDIWRLGAFLMYPEPDGAMYLSVLESQIPQVVARIREIAQTNRFGAQVRFKLGPNCGSLLPYAAEPPAQDFPLQM